MSNHLVFWDRKQYQQRHELFKTKLVFGHHGIMQSRALTYRSMRAGLNLSELFGYSNATIKPTADIVRQHHFQLQNLKTGFLPTPRNALITDWERTIRRDMLNLFKKGYNIEVIINDHNINNTHGIYTSNIKNKQIKLKQSSATASSSSHTLTPKSINNVNFSNNAGDCGAFIGDCICGDGIRTLSHSELLARRDARAQRREQQLKMQLKQTRAKLRKKQEELYCFRIALKRLNLMTEVYDFYDSDSNNNLKDALATLQMVFKVTKEFNIGDDDDNIP